MLNLFNLKRLSWGNDTDDGKQKVALSATQVESIRSELADLEEREAHLKARCVRHVGCGGDATSVCRLRRPDRRLPLVLLALWCQSHLLSAQDAVRAASLSAVTVDVPASHSLIKKYARCGAKPHRRPCARLHRCERFRFHTPDAVPCRITIPFSYSRLEHIDEILRSARLSGYLQMRTRWTALPGEPAPLDDSEVDDWLPRFVVLQGTCIFLYFVSTDLSPQDSTLLSDVVEVGHMPCHTQEDDDAARYHFYIVTRQGLRYECSSASKLQVDAWVATLQDECKLGSDSTTLDHLSDTSK
ncbi:putative pleckstrin domain, PH-like domain superfamily [Helianthus annuus]|nr:putative pleckstrin domain, PH-like domain superfamily [Helianthus annuus]KAJ0498880.1 putative pleckstrin domain, PH-like domain superfamily [Helianthus annuus]KAJ0664895.1 putative pleckstrin domain, PH-like domain superfamily [Helianthus annuus]KAJ0672325.1 putative pleckstrin domain, PH-like domain superfamily [Helianthus annuus]